MRSSADPHGARMTRGVTLSSATKPRIGWASIVVGGAYLLLWLGCALGGGSSRVDNPWGLVQRPVTVACLFVFLLASGPRDWRAVRAPLLLLGALGAVMLAQLVPLPPGLWHALPGRDRFAEGLVLADAGGAWLPLSVAPDRTWDSLASLIVPASVLIGYAALPARARAATLPGLILLGLASAFLGILQVSGGEGSPLYHYPKSNIGYPIGLLANRNHAGAFLALLLPALRAWSLETGSPGMGSPETGSHEPGGKALTPRRRRALAAMAGVFLVPMVFVTGSRAGLALLGVGMVAAYLVRPTRIDPRRIAPRTWMAIGIVVLAGAVALWAVLASGRAIAVDRLFHGDAVLDDPRFDFTPVVIEVLRAGFPMGWGFGTFDRVFQSFEPDRLLTLSYLNNAHDDLLELLLTGGVAAGLVLAAFLVWIARRGSAVFRMGTRSRTVRARAAAMMVVMLLLASLVDYPLRTPLLGAVLALLCAWMVDIRADGRPAGGRVASERAGL